MLPIFKSRIRIPRYAIKYHIIVWIIYVIYEVVLGSVFRHFRGASVDVLGKLLNYFILIPFFYLSLFYVIPHIIIKPRKPLKFILSYLVILFTYILIDKLQSEHIISSKISNSPFMHQILGIFFVYNSYLIFATGYAYSYLYIQEGKEKNEIEREANNIETKLLSTHNAFLKSQNDLFKAQINPHLLFNVLNSLKAQAVENNPELPENIQRVADIMRYSISSTSNQTSLVDIADEIAQMNNLIEIQKMRFETCSININCKGNIRRGNFITPLSFITALENAFKHGETRNRVHPIEVIIDVSNPYQIYFSCVNKIRKGSIEISHGIGIENTKNRLKQNFGEDFILNTFSEGDFYHYDLIIKRKPVTS
jgi:two-component system, LytTR family, sensor kinase